MISQTTPCATSWLSSRDCCTRLDTPSDSALGRLIASAAGPTAVRFSGSSGELRERRRGGNTERTTTDDRIDQNYLIPVWARPARGPRSPRDRIGVGCLVVIGEYYEQLACTDER